MAEKPANASMKEVYQEIVRPALVRRLVELCRDEDLGPDGVDITSSVMVDADERCDAWLVAREPGVVAGLEVVGAVLDELAPATLFREVMSDGTTIEAGTRLGALLGPKREILAAERTLLNVIGRLSGIATETARYVRAVEGTAARIVDTRKTSPGMRVLEKYAVRCGGGHGHRLGLHDAALIKDNHLAGLSAGGLAAAVADAARVARERHSPAFVMVEVDTLEQLDEVLTLDAGVVDIVLLDNMDAAAMRDAVSRRDASAAKPQLEASGGVSLETVAEIARTGVERIAVGAITHHADWLDVGLDVAG
ncbi:MAG: carboxylating nicotinate-nucleotide diphosphorylase [Planctomycetota bacterium]